MRDTRFLCVQVWRSSASHHTHTHTTHTTFSDKALPNMRVHQGLRFPLGNVAQAVHDRRQGEHTSVRPRPEMQAAGLCPSPGCIGRPFIRYIHPILLVPEQCWEKTDMSGKSIQPFDDDDDLEWLFIIKARSFATRPLHLFGQTYRHRELVFGAPDNMASPLLR